MEESEQPPSSGEAELQPLALQIPADLFRAYQRCAWMLISETGRGQHSVMAEMVRDFLIKHGC